MTNSLLELHGLDYTPAPTQEPPISASLWTQRTTVQDYQFRPESDEPDAGCRISDVLVSGVATPTIQIVFSPEKQDKSIHPPKGADLLDWLRNQYVHGSAKDVSKLTGDVLQTMVTHLSGLRATPLCEFDSASFRRTLVAQLHDEPIEDGVAHPAERLIDDSFRNDSAVCLQTLARTLKDNFLERPSVSASLLRCIGRMSFERVGHWGLKTVTEALYHDDVEVRDAAIRALEKWGGNESVRILRRHRDPEDWLNDYVKQVILDLPDNAA